VELRLGLDLQLPESYIAEAALRLSFYKRLAACDSEDALTELLEEMADRYGPAPPQVEALAEAQRVRMAARLAGVASVTRRGRRWRLRLDPAVRPSDHLAEAVSSREGAKLSPAGEITLPLVPEAPACSQVLEFLESLTAVH
jgi:transcription-repair coupling factor (superfamily II helicase)